MPEVGPLSVEAERALSGAFCIMKLQIISFAVYYYAWRSLYKKELNQPKIVDTIAANIKFAAKGGVTNAVPKWKKLQDKENLKFLVNMRS